MEQHRYKLTSTIPEGIVLVNINIMINIDISEMCFSVRSFVLLHPSWSLFECTQGRQLMADKWRFYIVDKP